MSNKVKVWYEDGGAYSVTWWWRDDLCDEPMGPFRSEGEARADYWACRIGESESLRHSMLDQGFER